MRNICDVLSPDVRVLNMCVCVCLNTALDQRVPHLECVGLLWDRHADGSEVESVDTGRLHRGGVRASLKDINEQIIICQIKKS